MRTDQPEYPNNSNDVRYHLGTLVRLYMAHTEKVMEICLASNPSHLEAVNSVVLGQARAAQSQLSMSEINIILDYF